YRVASLEKLQGEMAAEEAGDAGEQDTVGHDASPGWAKTRSTRSQRRPSIVMPHAGGHPGASAGWPGFAPSRHDAEVCLLRVQTRAQPPVFSLSNTASMTFMLRMESSTP